MEIGLVSCTKTKRDEAAPPGDLYDRSTLLSKAREYAETHHDSWFVLSAKYGLLEPVGDSIEPYDHTLTTARVAERRQWADDVYAQLQDADLIQEDVTLVFPAGRAYADKLTTRLADDPVSVAQPLEGLRIGERLAWYNEHT